MTADASPPDWDAIARFLSGESPAEEETAVARWLDANAADRELAERLNAAMVSANVPADIDIEAALSNVHARMALPIPQAALETATKAPRRPVRRWRSTAITGLAAAAIVGIIVIYQHTLSNGSTPRGWAHTYATSIGQRNSLYLPDGSHVLVGPLTRIGVPADYGVSSRDVEVTGDAYFDVRHDPAKPFTVRAGRALIEDIGTRFTVESEGASAGDPASVSVVLGSVRLRSTDAPETAGVVLDAGDRGSIDAEGYARVERHAVSDADTAWTTGRLVFNDAPLSRVIPKFQRWFGVTLVVSDSALLARTVHTSFTDESADTALKILGLTLGAQIERHGDSATVSASRGRTEPH